MKNEKLSVAEIATIANNLLFLRKKKGLTQEKMAEELGFSLAQYQHYELGIRILPLPALIKVSSYFHISMDAIVKADLSEVKQDGMVELQNGRMLLPIFITKEEKEEKEAVHVVTVKASAGYLRGYGDPTYFRKLPQVNLPFLRNGTFRGFPITGDSMLPIMPGTIIIGQFVENIRDIKNGKSYIVVTRDGIVYKRVERHYHVVTLISNNKFYEPYTISIEDIIELWEFRCFISTEEMDAYNQPLDALYPLISGTYNKIATMSEELSEMKSKLLAATNE